MRTERRHLAGPERRQRGEHTGTRRDADGERRDAQVRRDMVRHGQAFRQTGPQQLQHAAAERQSGRAAGHAHQEAFDERVLDETEPGRAEGQAGRQLVPAFAGPRGHQIRDIGAGDEHHEQHGRHEE